jgi:hypothetical protein
MDSLLQKWLQFAPKLQPLAFELWQVLLSYRSLNTAFKTPF